MSIKMSRLSPYFIVFDCDGTIVDSLSSIALVIQNTFKNVGIISPSKEAIKATIGLHLKDAFKVLLVKQDQELVTILMRKYKQEMSRHRELVKEIDPLYPDAKNIIMGLYLEGCTLGIATGKSKMGLERTLQHHDLTGYFSNFQTSDNCRSKPSPDMLNCAMAEMNMAPENTLMVGDTTYDMEMAINAGTKAIGVAWGYHDVDSLYSAGASVVIHKYRELRCAVEGIV